MPHKLVTALVAHLAAALAAVLLLAGLTAPASGHPGAGHPREEPAAPRPVVFVHGSSGSGSQFESQAQRYASNGYPVSWIEAHEYDSTFATNSLADVHAALGFAGFVRHRLSVSSDTAGAGFALAM